MLHSKFRLNQFIGSREELFKAFTIDEIDGHLGRVTWATYTYFDTPFLGMFHMKIGFH